ncbi:MULTISPECIES: hypothetical protein [Vibrio]|uniref:hypothetical protein n=1 Tax=Vibrio TaxID=662 RepID=UPI0002F7EBCD|nr:hypothetical protein [Vibrio crassostreae]
MGHKSTAMVDQYYARWICEGAHDYGNEFENHMAAAFSEDTHSASERHDLVS